MTPRNAITILDGGMSRELMRIKAPFKQPEWSAYALMKAPEKVKQVHEEFAAAGADVLTTNSYALVPYSIGEDVFRARGEELAASAGCLARKAADTEYARSGRRVLVAGSLPPIFGSYKPDLFDINKVQECLSVLVHALAPYVDIWLGETLSLIAEAKSVQAAVKETGKPLWISFTLDDTNEKEIAYLRSGESVAEGARWAMTSGVQALLFNCSHPEFMLTALREASLVFDQHQVTLPLGVYANGFVPDPESLASKEDLTAIRDDLDIRSYSSFANEWIDNGATIVGGCCGIGCEHIRQLAQLFGGNSHKYDA